MQIGLWIPTWEKSIKTRGRLAFKLAFKANGYLNLNNSKQKIISKLDVPMLIKQKMCTIFFQSAQTWAGQHSWIYDGQRFRQTARLTLVSRDKNVTSSDLETHDAGGAMSFGPSNRKVQP